jgi:hypothetical protein
VSPLDGILHVAQFGADQLRLVEWDLITNHFLAFVQGKTSDDTRAATIECRIRIVGRGAGPAQMSGLGLPVRGA